jgi:hypothetical protein
VRNASDNTLDLPPYLKEALANLPRNADKQALSEIISKLLFPVSDRTIEAWPLRWRRVNGHSLASTEEGLKFAWEKFRAAPVMRGGRRYTSVGDDDRDSAA